MFIAELLKVLHQILVGLSFNDVSVNIDRMQLDIRIYPEIQGTMLLSHLSDALSHELQKLSV